MREREGEREWELPLLVSAIFFSELKLKRDDMYEYDERGCAFFLTFPFAYHTNNQWVTTAQTTCARVYMEDLDG